MAAASTVAGSMVEAVPTAVEDSTVVAGADNESHEWLGENGWQLRSCQPFFFAAL
jgi:hypothetical protein